MIVLERMNGLANSAFKKSNRSRAINPHGKFLTIGAFGAVEWTTAAIANRRKNLANGLAAGGAKPFADAPAHDAAWWEKEIEQRLAQ